MKNLSQVHVGVDVSKEKLDIFIYPKGVSITVENSKKGINKLIDTLSKYDVLQVVFEATGGYEKQLHDMLNKKSYNCWNVDPRRIKGFIISTGCKAKTDKIDAKKIAEFSSKYSKDYDSTIRTAQEESLLSLVDRRFDLIKFLTSEKTRLKHPVHQNCITSIKKIIKMLEKEIKQIEKQVEKLIAENETISARSKLLESIPGIGKTTAATLIASVPEIGTISNNKISALVGLCPYEFESGSFKGKKFIRGGRIAPRNALYMCALTTIKYHLPLKNFYDRLIAANKPFKVAIVAVMRKLIVMANAILRNGEPCRL